MQAADEVLEEVLVAQDLVYMFYIVGMAAFGWLACNKALDALQLSLGACCSGCTSSCHAGKSAAHCCLNADVHLLKVNTADDTATSTSQSEEQEDLCSTVHTEHSDWMAILEHYNVLEAPSGAWQNSTSSQHAGRSWNSLTLPAMMLPRDAGILLLEEWGALSVAPGAWSKRHREPGPTLLAGSPVSRKGILDEPLSD